MKCPICNTKMYVLVGTQLRCELVSCFMSDHSMTEWQVEQFHGALAAAYQRGFEDCRELAAGIIQNYGAAQEREWDAFRASAAKGPATSFHNLFYGLAVEIRSLRPEPEKVT